MGLFQRAYETYENYEGRVGVEDAAEKTPLVPIFHMLANAQLEITIDGEGNFKGAAALIKPEKIIIPITEASAGRTGGNEAHPLCDQLQYVDPVGEKKYEAYLEAITRWAQSEHTHPKVQSVLRYVSKGQTLLDLQKSGYIPEDRSKLEKYKKHLIRWRVLSPSKAEKEECWKDQSLFDKYIQYYESQQGASEQLCMISGEMERPATSHPKGTVAFAYGAKLISAYDPSGFTYRGRFLSAEQAGSIGYIATQKAHSALRWIIGNQGVVYGGRVFLCWNPQGRQIKHFNFLSGEMIDTRAETPEQFQYKLEESLKGTRLLLEEEEDVVIASFEAATTGRLSVTYYNELKASDFMKRLRNWYGSCCWFWGRKAEQVQSPSAYQLIACAFGVERKQREKCKIEVDDKLLKGQIQRIFHCIVDGQPLPVDIVRNLAVRASTPLAYEGTNRENLLSVACAAIRKYHNDKLGVEEWKMELQKDCKNRSYLFGRLLAVAEAVERNTYTKEETREPNAIRMQLMFSERPFNTWRILEEALLPYYARLKVWRRQYYKSLEGEILKQLGLKDDKLDQASIQELNKKLDDEYLLGYYLQRTELYQSKNKEQTEQMEGMENE